MGKLDTEAKLALVFRRVDRYEIVRPTVFRECGTKAFAELPRSRQHPDHPEVPPDNNLAERSLRLAVTKRKVSGGSRSQERFSQTANLLSVVQTCRRQGRSVIEFFKQAMIVQLGTGHPQPSLCPQFLLWGSL